VGKDGRARALDVAKTLWMTTPRTIPTTAAEPTAIT
jgi:hypothetical protein